MAVLPSGAPISCPMRAIFLRIYGQDRLVFYEHAIHFLLSSNTHPVTLFPFYLGCQEAQNQISHTVKVFLLSLMGSVSPHPYPFLFGLFSLFSQEISWRDRKTHCGRHPEGLVSCSSSFVSSGKPPSICCRCD